LNVIIIYAPPNELVAKSLNYCSRLLPKNGSTFEMMDLLTLLFLLAFALRVLLRDHGIEFLLLFSG